MFDSALILLRKNLTTAMDLLAFIQLPKGAKYTFRPDSEGSIPSTRSIENKGFQRFAETRFLRFDVILT